MVKEAQANAADDAKRKEVVDARNGGDQAIYAAESALNELGEKVNGADRAEAEAAINDLRDALKSDDLARIKRATESLQSIVQRIGQAAYQQPGNAQGPSQGGGANDEGVVEGEYRAM
jgi:molecular chaperone DnaK